jgi:hypothetical protein
MERYDETPTKYDLYYFKWHYYIVFKSDVCDHIAESIRYHRIGEQYALKYLYYTLSNLDANYECGWSEQDDYTIITDYCILTTLTNILETKISVIDLSETPNVLDYRKQEFKLPYVHHYNLIELIYCNDLLNNEEYREYLGPINKGPAQIVINNESISDVYFDEYSFKSLNDLNKN